MTYFSLLKKTEEDLKNSGVDSPRFSSKLLIEHFFNIPQYKLFLEIPINKNSKIINAFNNSVEKMKKGYPIDYVLGYKNFFDLKLSLNENTLIPRPETEGLVELIVNENRSYNGNFADIGTGCGAIALKLAKTFPFSEVYATDIDLNALKMAEENSKKLNIKNIKFFYGKNYIPIEKEIKNIGIIVSNPPYIKTELINELDPKVKNFEPLKALDGGKNGTEIIENLINKLPAKTKLYIEIADYNVPEIKRICLKNGFSARFEKDTFKKIRYAIINEENL